MIEQTDTKLPEIINKKGCYLMSLIAMVFYETGKIFDAEDIEIIYEICLANNTIDKNCTINNPDAVLRKAFDIANSSKKILQIGIIKYGEISFWGWVKDFNAEYVIRKYKTNSGNHFVLLDKGKGILYNPDETVETWDVEADVLYKRFI